MSRPEAIEPFVLDIAEARLTDLRARIANTRWPERETVGDWSQGAPLDAVKALCDHWARDYDWRRLETRLNAIGQFRTVIDGLAIHFLHVRSSRPDARPILLTHGWPGSIVEFLDVIGPLGDPDGHGAPGAPAFHLVIPSLPGFGFSDKPAQAGWGVERIAAAWATLMERLGYDAFVAQGGDWGSTVTTALAMSPPPGLQSVHLTMPLVFPGAEDMADLTPWEQESVGRLKHFEEVDSGYAKLQATRPQTLGYALTDSAVGQAAWIYEKFRAWVDHSGAVEDVIGRDALIDNIMFYWLPGTAASSARLYWESLARFTPGRIDLPVGVSVFPRETIRPSRRWAERSYADIVYWNETEQGGHFAAFETPDIFVRELRAWATALDARSGVAVRNIDGGPAK